MTLNSIANMESQPNSHLTPLGIIGTVKDTIFIKLFLTLIISLWVLISITKMESQRRSETIRWWHYFYIASLTINVSDIASICLIRDELFSTLIILLLIQIIFIGFSTFYPRLFDLHPIKHAYDSYLSFCDFYGQIMTENIWNRLQCENKSMMNILNRVDFVICCYTLFTFIFSDKKTHLEISVYMRIVSGITLLTLSLINVSITFLLMKLFCYCCLDMYKKSTQIKQTYDNECSICQSDSEIPWVTLKICRHNYHTECINEWIVYRQNCPLCRKEIDFYNTMVRQTKI